MHWFGFVYSVRFWVPVWLGFLFVGLLPLPPAAELVITVGALSHSAWYLGGRLRRAAQWRVQVRAEKAEEEEYRRQRRRRSPQGDSSDPSSRIRLLEPIRHDLLVAAPEDQR
jgi:hypothetical protein